MTDDELARFLTPSDVANLLSVSITEVHRLLRNGELIGFRIADRGPYRIDVAEVEAFIQQRYSAEHEDQRLRQVDFSNVTDFTDGRLL